MPPNASQNLAKRRTDIMVRASDASRKRRCLGLPTSDAGRDRRAYLISGVVNFRRRGAKLGPVRHHGTPAATESPGRWFARRLRSINEIRPANFIVADACPLQFSIRAIGARSSSRNDLELPPSTRRRAGNPGRHSQADCAWAGRRDGLEGRAWSWRARILFFACRLIEVRTSRREYRLWLWQFSKNSWSMDWFAGTPKKPLDAWSVKGRCRQREERDDRANVLGHGDRGWWTFPVTITIGKTDDVPPRRKGLSNTITWVMPLNRSRKRRPGTLPPKPELG